MADRVAAFEDRSCERPPILVPHAVQLLRGCGIVQLAGRISVA